MKVMVEGSPLEKIDPGKYGLSTRDSLASDGQDHLILIKDRKSRIIMKDGKDILKKTNLIKESGHSGRISFATSAPVCSKTTKLLKENGIRVLKLGPS